MGNSLEKESKKAIERQDPNGLLKLVTDAAKDGESLDVFKIIHVEKIPGQPDVHFDFISYALAESETTIQRSAYLKLFKSVIEKNNKSPKAKSFTAPQPQTENYLEILGEFACQSHDELDNFRFVLDNLDVFQCVNGESSMTLLHQLCASYSGIQCLQEFLSSGAIDDRFKNNRSSDDKGSTKMRSASKFEKKTPLQVAAACLNTDAVRELCVSNVGGGGENYCEAMQDMFLTAAEYKRRKQFTYEHEKKMIQIALCILSQPGSETVRSFGMQTNNNSNNDYNANNNIKLILNIIEKEDAYAKQLLFRHSEFPRAGDLLVRALECAVYGISFATAACFMGLDDLYRTLIANGCQLTQIQEKMFSGGLYTACQTSNINKVKEILNDKRFEALCDINKYNNRNRPGDAGGTCKKVASSSAIVKMLEEAGAKH